MYFSQRYFLKNKPCFHFRSSHLGGIFPFLIGGYFSETFFTLVCHEETRGRFFIYTLNFLYMQSPNRNQIHRALMLQNDPEIGSHKNLNPETSQMLEILSRKLADTPRSVRVNFVTGLGLSDVGMPCRLNTIIIPTLRVMRRLREL
jgi:hypothetical protein